MTCSLWFYSKDEANNFNSSIEGNDAFKFFKHKANTVADGTNGVLKNSGIAVSLKYLK